MGQQWLLHLAEIQSPAGSSCLALAVGCGADCTRQQALGALAYQSWLYPFVPVNGADERGTVRLESAVYQWTPSGLPCYRVGQAPPFLWTESQLRAIELRAGGGPCAFVDSQYGPAALYLITDAALADPDSWPPARPES